MPNTITPQQYYDMLENAATDGTFPGYENWHCRYRSDDGKHRCAIGILFPDDVSFTVDEHNYDDGCNGISVLPDVLLEQMTKVEGFNHSDYAAVQFAHDNVADRARVPRWSADEFINRINALPCFANVAQVLPQQ